MTASEKLKCLREHMQKHNVDAFIALSADPHMSEYLPDYWKIREWLTGFTGSVGTILVTQDIAGLWVDGRYWVQAETQLKDTGFSLQKLTSDESSSHWAWLSQNLKANANVSVNTQTVSVQQFEVLQRIAKLNNFNIVENIDLISEVWQDRPALPVQAVYEMKEGINALPRTKKNQ